jgi:acetyl-CoA C-acetyltransferase
MRVGVLGIGKTPHKIQHHKSLRDLAVESGRAALADAGVEPADIQALYVGNVGSVGFNYENSTGLMVAHHLGVVPAGSVRVEAACGTGAWALHLGCVAIVSGLYDTVMVLGVEKMNDLATVEGTSIIAQAADSKEEYFSGLTFPSGVALTARKYMQTYELSEEDLAHTSVKNHHYGARNPYAHLRFECTVEEVMRSAKVADPLKLYEVCPMTDASSALVLCREEILRDQPDKPQVYVTATAGGSRPPYPPTRCRPR